MYIDRQIRSLLETAKITGSDQWINIKATKEKVKEYKEGKKEFTVEELVGMVQLTDKEVMAKDQMVKDLRFKLYATPSAMDEIYKEMEMMFKGHVMVLVKNTPNGKFVIDKLSN